MGILKKAEKAIDLLKTKYMMKFDQKVYHGKKYDIKYILEENKKSSDIVIVFTACTKVGQKARYNYIKTLDEFKCNKLFILDDFGFDGRGAYYLGKDKDFAIQEEVKKLIEEVCSKSNSKREFYIGSSKGGYAALYFGVERKGSNIITGAPQYNLGDYLNKPGHKEILRYIMGDLRDESINELNSLLENKLVANESNITDIYIHYSNSEETYLTDLKPLVEKLMELKYNKHYDEEEYKSHSDLTLYFPKYIKEILREKLNR